MSQLSQPVMIQGDREIFSEDIDHIRTILERFSSLSRHEITLTLCETLEWLTPAGRPKIDACTKLLNRLQDDGMICLPALQDAYIHHSRKLKSIPITMSTRSAPQPDLETSLAALGTAMLTPCHVKADQSLWNEYVQRYHYLGYKKPFGYRQRYFIEAGPHRLGCILLSGAAKSLGARDRWIGWDERQRLKNLPWVLNNSRFLIFPWVKIPNLASHVLGKLAHQAGDDWMQRWGFRPVLLETFVDPERFHGGCYRAAGWELPGRTTGAGLVRKGKQYQTTPKLIFTKPLQADFRRLLCSNQLKGRAEP
jgi:hypothetical protein